MNKNDKSRPLTKRHEVDPKNIKEFVVKEPCELLSFLLEKLPALSRNNVKRLLANHQVAVDGAPISQFNFLLAKEDIVIVSNNRIAAKKRENLPIIFEDEEFIVIDKPSGLLSVASDKIKGRTAYRMLMDYVQQKDKHNRIYVVHRLDEDTSGVMMVAKNSMIRDALQKSWSNIVTSRGYYAIVEGALEKKEDTLHHYLAENNLNLMYVTPNKKMGKECITRYKVISENKDYSLLDVHISSGRKNQIRVQLGHIGHHVIGDDKYGEPADPLKRLGLHAYELAFIHPVKKKEFKFVSQMPSEFKALFFAKKIK
ncbi:MAG TPA: RluA family pseudouridine synthase [Bacilli bacterium]|jgi:23S rRNA pseudouridine1911/1915/1917 synthase|nr:RluA family pseudouridine synthase [Bacilli bacterium]HPV69428.1 RluA family pseudouridine synthase [Bacilli bacterium]